MKKNSNCLNILLVSSRPPEHSANLGGDIVQALQKVGCTVEYLSLYPSKQKNEYAVYSVLDCAPKTIVDKLRGSLSESYFNKIRKVLKPILAVHRNLICLFSQKQKIIMHSKASGFNYFDENTPDINPGRILSIIPKNKKYDFIITAFWQGMLNSTSINALYNRFKVPVYIYSVDMATITGGCFYFNTCDHYKNECGKCPCLLSSNPNDRSHNNYLIKRNNYSKSEVYYIGNSWMIKHAIASRLFNSKNVLNMSIILDETVFYPARSSRARDKMNLPAEKDFILLVRSNCSKRKGSDIIIYTLKHLWENLSETHRQRLCLVSIGDRTLEERSKEAKIPIINLGIVDREMMISLYRESTLFLSPSTDDAGPSMVNQSMMCGTPVVSFNLGTAMDVIENGVSGFKTDNISNEGYAKLMENTVEAIIQNKYPRIRETTRETALKYNTSQVFAYKLLNHFSNLQKERS